MAQAIKTFPHPTPPPVPEEAHTYTSYCTETAAPNDCIYAANYFEAVRTFLAWDMLEMHHEAHPPKVINRQTEIVGEFRKAWHPLIALAHIHPLLAILMETVSVLTAGSTVPDPAGLGSHSGS